MGDAIKSLVAADGSLVSEKIICRDRWIEVALLGLICLIYYTR